MTPLERRYRRLLRLLPPDYREQREAEMVDTFLLSTRTGDPIDDEVTDLVGHPSWGERASVLRLAVQLRLTGGGSVAPARSRALGGAVRWWVTCGLLIHAVLSLYAVLSLAFWRLAGASMDTGSWGLSDREWLLFALQALWIPAFFALLWGRVRAARALAVLATCVGVLQALGSTAVAVVSDAAGPWSSYVTGWVIVAVDLLLLLGLWAFRDREPVSGRGGWCAAGAALVLALALCVAIAVAGGVASLVLLDQFSIWSLTVLGAAVVVVWRSTAGESTAARATQCAGLALLCLTAVVLRMWLVVDLLVTGSWGAWSPWLTGSLVVQLVIPVAVGLVAASAASREVRTLEITS